MFTEQPSLLAIVRSPNPLSFDGEQLHEIQYEDTAPMQIVRRFVNHRDRFLEELFGDTPMLFDKKRD